ncbi:hypothetical protein ACWEWD_13795 [Streptomyces tendae]
MPGRHYFGVDLRRRPAAGFEDVVLVVQVGESFSQGQFVPEALVDPEDQLAWRQLAGQHSGGKCSYGGFLSGNAARRVEGEAQLVKCWGKDIEDVVIRLSACACGQHSQGGAVESGDERIADASDDVGRRNLVHAPQDGMVRTSVWLSGEPRRRLSQGGTRTVARAAQVSGTPVGKGADELEAGEEPLCRVRWTRGGRSNSGFRHRPAVVVGPAT